MDKREQILVRLRDILTELGGSDVRVWRNRAELDDSELPAYVLLDGTETKAVGAQDQGGRRGPQIMVLSPQIFFVPVRTENQMNAGIGELLSQHRISLLRTIIGDGQLADLTGRNGYAEYRGMETDMQTGAEVKGQMRLDFAFAYDLNFSKI